MYFTLFIPEGFAHGFSPERVAYTWHALQAWSGTYQLLSRIA
jgi:hypothetical protein